MRDFGFIADAPIGLGAATAAPARSRIQVAQIGRWTDPRYGSFGITVSEVDNWSKLLASHFQGRLPIDEDHRTDKGVSSEASGWIVGLARDGDKVFADVEWTPKGEAAIREKRYLYISPTFVSDLKDKAGKNLGPALLRAALTNSPFLQDMPAVTLSAGCALIHADAATSQRAILLQSQIAAAADHASVKGTDFGQALAVVTGAQAEPPADADLDSVTFRELCDDSQRMHDVVLAVMQAKRTTYMEALDHLLNRHEERAEWLSGEDRDAITLSAVLDGGGVSIGRVTSLVAELKQVRTLAAPPGLGKLVPRDIDDWGRVRLPLGTDLDALLADELAVIHDFRRARELGLVADDGMNEPKKSDLFADFERAWRSEVNKGFDLLATLELRDAERQAELVAQQQVAAIEQQVQQERLDAARAQRQLSAQLLEDAKRLENR